MNEQDEAIHVRVLLYRALIHELQSGLTSHTKCHEIYGVYRCYYYCCVIETFYLQTFDIYWLFFLIFSAIVWPLQHEKWNDVDNTKISGTSLIGCCVAICRDSGSMDYDRRISIGRLEPYHQLPSRNVRGDY